MSTQMVRPQPAMAPRGYQRRGMPPRRPSILEDDGRRYAPATFPGQPPAQTQPGKGPVAEYAPPEDVEAYSKDEPYGGEPEYAPPPPRTSAPGYNRYTGTNSGDMISNDRDFAYGRGDELYQNSKDRGANESQVRSNYRAYGDEVYDPLIGGRGGYNPDEAARIDRSGDFDQYMTNPGEYDQNYLNQDEQSAIAGRPWDRAAFYNPQDDIDRERESAARQRGAVDEMQTGLYESLDGDLGLSDDYSQGVDRTLSGTASRARGSYDPAALRADKTSLDRIRMTPEEEQDIITKAGISGGTKYRAAAGELDRRSRAAGIDPVGAAAVRGRYMRNAAADSADAMTGARVQASNARAGREGTAETLRMGGERTAADIGTGTELALGSQAMSANTTREGLRLGAQRDISSRRADLAKTVGGARQSGEEAINAQQRQQRQFNTTTGTGIATGVESDAAARAAAIAAQRIAASRANQAQRFQQGATRIGASSDMAQTVAGARRADAQEGRGYIREQAGVANTNAQNDYNRQASIYATQGQLGQATTGAQIQKDARPKWWEQMIAAAAAGAGTAAKSGGG